MTHANKKINPQNFRSDLANISIQIRSNLEIRIHILDHILALAEPMLSEFSCLNGIFNIVSSIIVMLLSRLIIIQQQHQQHSTHVQHT